MIADFFDIEDLQRLQDLFSDATGVAAIIRHPDGRPVTRPSNYSRLCSEFYPATDDVTWHCMQMDNLPDCSDTGDSIVYSCLHNLFWGSGTHLVIGGTHLATWIIGQVRKTDADEEEIKRCAARIGLDPIVFNAEYRQVPVMTEEQFARIARMLQAFAGELSLKVFQNKQLEEQIMARQKAEEQMSMLAFALKSISEGICISDLDDKIIHVNESFLRIYGYTAEELLGQQVSMVRSDNNNPAVIEGVLPATLQGGWKGELLNMRKDGTEFPVYISTSVVCNDRGEPVALMGVASDITENKMFEEALRESETKYRSLFDGARDAIFIMNNQCFLDCNRSTGRIFGVTADQIIGASPTDYSPTYQPDGQLSTVKAQHYIDLALAGESQTFDWVHTHLDGTPFFAEVALNRIMLNGNWYLQAIVRDITKRKQTEDAIREKAKELERFNKLMIGREIRMAELKQEVNLLLHALNQPEKYKVNE